MLVNSQNHITEKEALIEELNIEIKPPINQVFMDGFFLLHSILHSIL